MKQYIFKYGIIAGLSVIAYTWLLYYITKQTLFTPTYYVSSLIFYVVCMYLAANKVKTADFKGVLKTAFAVFLIANCMYYIFDFILYNYIDTSLATGQADAAIAYMRSNPNPDFGEQIKIEDNIRNNDIHNISTLSYLLIRSAIGGFGLSVVITYLIKRKL